MQIGDLAARTGVSAKTIRYYEQIGLLDPPARTASGYRDYEVDVQDRLRFIRTAQRVGFSLAQIAEVISLRREGAAPCDHVRHVLRTRLDEVECAIAELDAMAQQLRRSLARGERVDPARCEPQMVCEIITAEAPAVTEV